ncbi:MAG: 3-dehydroquinate synthase [Ignavibacteria bacterium]
MKKIDVRLKENPYQVFTGSNLLSALREQLEKRELNKDLLIITDGNVNKLYGDVIREQFINYESRVNYFVLKPGEETKSYEWLNKIYAFMLSKNYGRDSVIIAIGGGVTGDLAGYAAATFMRGVKFVQVPTTLLAMVDSSVGGKTGINFNKSKNIIGAFYQPEFVIADLNFLSTLPESELICGLGEILKYAFLSDSEFFSYIDKNAGRILTGDEKVTERIVSQCIEIKASVVADDEKESGLRKILNLGHTFAHSYESVLNYSVKHGSAVMMGLACALILSKKCGLTDDEKFARLGALLKKFNPGYDFSGLSKPQLYKLMLHDKKNRGGMIKFVLPLDNGITVIDYEAGREDVLFSLKEAEKFFIK